MQHLYLRLPIKPAAVLYSEVYCGQQNGGHANHGIWLLVMEAGERRMGEGWGVWFKSKRVAGSRLWGSPIRGRGRGGVSGEVII